jgi:dephospho-CoA kinase
MGEESHMSTDAGSGSRPTGSNLRVVGLTGGVGMGKTACAQWFREHSVPAVDTDDLARQVVEPGQPALKEIVKAFGPQVVNSGGELRREFLAEQVFSNPQARQQLESILHPRIRALWRAQAEIWAAEGRELAVVIIPLLFETKAQGEFDATVCAACSTTSQRQRLLARGWTAQHIDQRIAAQLPTDQKAAEADFVVWTEGLLDVTGEQLERVLRSLRR